MDLKAMQCAKQIEVGGEMRPCGQCINCRINQKRMWTGRIILEAAHAGPSSFLSLTYDQDNYERSLKKTHLQGYIDDIRHSSIGKVRYYGCGEYGEEKQRAHYHLMLFGVDPYVWEDKLKSAWKRGFVHVGSCERGSAAYISGYVTKKMTSHDDDRLDGRAPEFGIQSRFPPLGAGGMRHILETLTTQKGARGIAKYGDVPGGYRIQGITYPFGRYWRNWLRERLDVKPNVVADWEMDYEQAAKEQQIASGKAAKLWRRRSQEKTVL